MKRLTLGHVFSLSVAGLAVLLGALLALVLGGSERQIVESGGRLRAAYAERIEERVLHDLGRAEKVLLDLERQIRVGACRVDDLASLEASFFAEILNNPDLAEVTLTYAPADGHDESGALRLRDSPRFQVSVFRETPLLGSPVLTRTTRVVAQRARTSLRRRPAEGQLGDAKVVATDEEARDPTEDATFVTPASAPFYGRTVWTDLSWAEADKTRPEAERRVVLGVLKAIVDRSSAFAGVLRVASRAEQVDRLTAMNLQDRPGADPHVKFLTDGEGRLVTRLYPGDRLADAGDDTLRVVSERRPAEIEAALQAIATTPLSAEAPRVSLALRAGGRRFLVSLRALTDETGQPLLGGLSDWRIGIVVPEEHYLGGLRRTRNEVVAGAAFLIALLLAGGLVALGSVRRGLLRIVDETRRLRGFDFSPHKVVSPFADVRGAMESLELAKTAMRAMGKYVPVDLVRELYASNREPELGGRLCDVTVMFTDIEGFTTLSERLPPDVLARALGHYLQAMTQAVHASGGIVDKYIGDAVMALWNAPREWPDHPARACGAALRCLETTRALYSSAEWEGLPPLVTRFGLHRAEVMVGHFGAPERLSYTALGDGVNLASRLEGLNKIYGTQVLVTEAVANAAAEAFAFRRLDRVAVKGKTQGVAVFELLGPNPGSPATRVASARAYEEALDRYFARDFDGARALLEPLSDDPASRVLEERCRSLSQAPPPADWNGVHVAREK